jgi:predicted alpha/beta-hydrolase family hydrolase
MPVLVERIRAIAAEAREHPQGAGCRLILAGHSMGGRASSMAVAQGLAADGLLLFSYPWHPPGKPDKPRIGHLEKIKVPVLGLTGTRDAFCERERLQGVFDKLPSAWTQVWLEGADHGLETLKKGGRSREDVMSQARAEIRRWLGGFDALD